METNLDQEVIDQSMEPVITKNDATFYFSNITEEELGAKLEKYLLQKGYKIEAGTPTNATYGKGSQILRILFGAFVKRFAWTVKIQSSVHGTTLTFAKMAKGYAGGIIGVNQVNGEFTQIVNSLKKFYESVEKPENVE
ncbi:MAG: hypothetical protein ACPG21_13030 [Crocinitomicaceae bacterium]